MSLNKGLPFTKSVSLLRVGVSDPQLHTPPISWGSAPPPPPGYSEVDMRLGGQTLPSHT